LRLGSRVSSPGSGVRRQPVHEWLAKYEAGGLEGLENGFAPAPVAPAPDVGRGGGVVEQLRRAHPFRGPRRVAFEVGKRGWSPVPRCPRC